MAENAYAVALAELSNIRRRLEAGTLEPAEVEVSMVQAKAALVSGRAALRRVEATIEVLEVTR